MLALYTQIGLQISLIILEDLCVELGELGYRINAGTVCVELYSTYCSCAAKNGWKLYTFLDGSGVSSIRDDVPCAHWTCTELYTAVVRCLTPRFDLHYQI